MNLSDNQFIYEIITPDASVYSHLSSDRALEEITNSTRLQEPHTISLQFSNSSFPNTTSLEELDTSSENYVSTAFQDERPASSNSFPVNGQNARQGGIHASHLQTTTTAIDESVEIIYEFIEETSAMSNDQKTSKPTAHRVSTPRKESPQKKTTETISDISTPTLKSSPVNKHYITPPTRPAPVKGMPFHRGKHISRKDRVYAQRQVEDETDTENHVTMDEPTSEQSAGEEMSYSPATSSNSESSLKHREKNLSSRKSKDSRPNRKSITPDHSPPRSNAPPVSGKKRVTCEKRIPEALRTKIARHNSPSAPIFISDSEDPDNNHHAVSPQVSSRVHGTPTDSELIENRVLMVDLRGSELAQQTIANLLQHCKTSPRLKINSLIEMVTYITYTKAEKTVTTNRRHRIQVYTKDYLLCSDENYHGYIYEDIYSNPNLAKESLLMALRRDKCMDQEHSLDLVFRAALKEIASEMHAYDIDRDLGLDNPIFISGRYLELSLLQKIRAYYLELRKKDVIRCLAPTSVNDETCELQEFIRNSGSKFYLRRLIGQYEINSSNFNRIIEKKICTPQEMRVWTNARAQRDVNAKLKSHMLAVLERTKHKWGELSDEARNVPLSYFFIDQHCNQIKPFMASHDAFLSTILKASELMAWMCFGITTDSRAGHVLFAESFIQGKRLEETNIPNKKMCWNYPLAAIFRKEQITTTDEAVFMLNADSYRTFDELNLS